MHPYRDLTARAFWASAVAQRNMFDIDELWDPKFRITADSKVATFGSCFAQHFGQALKKRGFRWHVTETAPAGLSPAGEKKFNYGVFSARTGNIYTATLLKQWVSWALGDAPMPQEIWKAGDLLIDPFRPNIEPDGFSSEQELRASQEATLAAFRDVLVNSDVFVFTLGLTESWVNSELGYEYPMCPGTVAGEFDGTRHAFVNQEYPVIRSALIDVIKRVRQVNPGIRFLLTVSPVPLTATKSGNHVLVATMESKSTLRAVAGAVARSFPFVDYFPSFEIINATPFRGAFFEANQRNVATHGVAHVMKTFFASLDAKYPSTAAEVAPASSVARVSAAAPEAPSVDDVVCEEELLARFAPASV